MKKSESANLPTKYGDFIIKVWPEEKGCEPVALITPKLDTSQIVLVRIHSECLTGDVLGSLKCDCGDQKDQALKKISEFGNGIFIYLRQEGRGIGLYEKIKAYKLQEVGQDTYDANISLGHKPDERDYSTAEKILKELGIKKIKLLTNNPLKVSEIISSGIKVVERIPLVVATNPYSEDYINTKKAKFNHIFES